MRVAFFGSGSPQSVKAIEALARDHDVRCVIVPQAASAAPLVERARQMRIETLSFARSDEAQAKLANSIRQRGAELLCIASFPAMLRAPLLTLPAINAHMSLLPRHRGADPIFWTYYCADEQAGVTIHAVDAAVDAGPIIAQSTVPVARGRASRDLYLELADLSASLLAETVGSIERGTATRTPQDEAQATTDPAPRDGTVRPNFAGWPVQRAWHFLAGLSDQRTDLAVDASGGVHRHRRAIACSAEPTRVPGTIVETRNTIEVHCADGFVTLERLRSGLFRRIVARLRSLRG